VFILYIYIYLFINCLYIQELQIQIEIDDNSDNNPLIDVQISIDKVLQNYRKIKEERMTELNKLQEEVISIYYLN